MMLLAIRITARTLAFITPLNDGVVPPLPSEEGNFFVCPVVDYDNEFNELWSPEDFYRMYPNASKKALVQSVLQD